jgi:hypothetical protein
VPVITRLIQMMDYLLDKKFTDNALFTKMEVTVVRKLMEGFEMMTLKPDEIVYNVRHPPNASRPV